jgi:hypothetical protein
LRKQYVQRKQGRKDEWEFLRSLTVCRFSTPEELAERVQQDVQRVLIDRFRKQQESQPQESQPLTPSPTAPVSLHADNGSVAGYHIGNITINHNNR